MNIPQYRFTLNEKDLSYIELPWVNKPYRNRKIPRMVNKDPNILAMGSIR